MHLEAIDIDLWYVVENGVPKAGEGVTAADVKKFVQLDSTAKNIICGIQLNELLDINSGDTFTSLGNAILNDIPEVDINGFKMHVHLILTVGVISAIKDGAHNGDHDYPCSRHS